MGRGRQPHSDSVGNNSKRERQSTPEELQITIPILKPKGWREVQPLLDGKGVTFDERGVKETMTVKNSRWEAFVDRQKEKLKKEITEARSTRGEQNGDASRRTETAKSGADCGE